MTMLNFAGLEFIFRFLPIFLIIYYIVPMKHREGVLLLGSLLFYAMGEPQFVIVLIGISLINFWIGHMNWKLGKEYSSHNWKQRKRIFFMIEAIILDILVLLLFKVLGTFVNHTLLPIGISFYIFKMISYQVDIYKREIWQKPDLKYTLLYFSMFPQVLSGPIMRYNEGCFDVKRHYSWEQFEDGLKYFIIGLGMKILLADRLSILWNDLQMIGFQSISTPLAWFGIAGFSLELYFDFWGYSLMAAGILVMLGYSYIENFNHPYAARSVSEFYRRWHVTLGEFFRDYLYIPMGGSMCKKWRMILNLTVVWLVTGIWHGNGVNFLLWGAVLGMIIILEKLFYGKKISKIPLVGNLYVLFVIPLTWVLFAITDLQQIGIYFGRLFPFLGGAGIAVNPQDITKYVPIYGGLFVAGILLCIPTVFHYYEKHKKNPVIIVGLVATFWFSIYFLVSNNANPFMYFKF